jgi:hypothetical protein
MCWRGRIALKTAGRSGVRKTYSACQCATKHEFVGVSRVVVPARSGVPKINPRPRPPPNRRRTLESCNAQTKGIAGCEHDGRAEAEPHRVGNAAHDAISRPTRSLSNSNPRDWLRHCATAYPLTPSSHRPADMRSLQRMLENSATLQLNTSPVGIPRDATLRVLAAIHSEQHVSRAPRKEILDLGTQKQCCAIRIIRVIQYGEFLPSNLGRIQTVGPSTPKARAGVREHGMLGNSGAHP